MITPVSVWVFRVLAVLALLHFGRSAFGLRRSESTEVFIKNLLNLGAIVYPIGVFLKFGLVGPDWVRFHMSDLAFPIAVATFILQFAWVSAGRSDSVSVVVRSRRLMIAAAIGLAFSVAIECFEGYAVVHLYRYNQGIGAFDWIDIACYVAGTLYVVGVALYWRRATRCDAQNDVESVN